MSKGHVDATAGGAFLSLNINEATALIEKMVENQSWGEGRMLTPFVDTYLWTHIGRHRGGN